MAQDLEEEVLRVIVGLGTSLFAGMEHVFKRKRMQI
jgi:hypothetical protein